MFKIEYPPYQPKIKKEDQKELIFDEVRKRWVALTPEEWVRQNILQYLVRVKRYPASWIAVEKVIRLGELKKRFDIVVYDERSVPWMIIECKEMQVALDQSVLDQVMRYNITLQLPFLVITNGMYCHVFENVQGHLTECNEMPSSPGPAPGA